MRSTIEWSISFYSIVYRISFILIKSFLPHHRHQHQHHRHRGHYYSTVELLKAHADIHHRNKIGLNSLHTAIAGHQPLLLEAILKTEESWATGIWKEEYVNCGLCYIKRTIALY